MFKGIQIDYKVKKGKNSRVAHLLYGTFQTNTKDHKKYKAYRPGILSELPYQKIFDGRIIASTDYRPDFSSLLFFCDELIVSSVIKTSKSIKPLSGREKWKLYAEEKGWDAHGI